MRRESLPAVMPVMTTLHAPELPGVRVVVVVRSRRGVVIPSRSRIVIRPRSRVVIHSCPLTSFYTLACFVSLPPGLRRCARAQRSHDCKKHYECTDHTLHCTHSNPHPPCPSMLSSLERESLQLLMNRGFRLAHVICKRDAGTLSLACVRAFGRLN